MSDSNFVFGTRYPYLTENNRDENGEIPNYYEKYETTQTYEYGEGKGNLGANASTSIGNASGNINTLYPVDVLGLNGLYVLAGQSGSMKWNSGAVEYLSYSGDSIIWKRKGGTQSAESQYAKFRLDVEPIENSKLIEKIKAYEAKIKNQNIFGSSFEVDGVQPQDNFINKNDNKTPYEDGKGKYLRLKIFKGKVSEIGVLLGNGLVRKDALFNNDRSQDWKKYTQGPYQINVDPKIELIPENFVFRSGFKYSLGLATEVTNSGPFKTINNLAGGAAMIDAISQSLKGDNQISINEIKNLNFNERVNRFRNIPYFKDLDNNCIDSLNFKFNYGQYGLYNCLEEVVKPILALASIFSYNFCKYDENDKNEANLYIEAPFEPKFNLMTKMYKKLFENTQSALKTLLNTKEQQKASTLSGIPEMLTNLVNQSAMENETQIITFAIGSSIYGPYYVSNVRWEFDYERTDGNGLPFSGEITLGGIKPLLIESLEGLLMTGGQIVSKEGV